MRDSGLRPVVKWAGGKRRLLDRILPLVPDDVSIYCEPFVGGGAVWLAVRPDRAVVNDRNTDLVDLYWTLGDGNRTEAMLDLLRAWPDDKDFFMEVRSWDRDPDYFAHRDLRRDAEGAPAGVRPVPVPGGWGVLTFGVGHVPERRL